jgi:SPP1 gp7 family putative phage head morphogenesis protein
MSRMVTGWEDAVREAMSSKDKAAADDKITALKALSKHLKIKTTDMTGIMFNLYSDAGLAGTQHTVKELAGKGVAHLDSGMAQLAGSIDWDTWKPGHPLAAKKVAGDALWNVLNETGITLLDIGNYTHKRIGNILADGLTSGATYSQIGAKITTLLKDRTRSDVVAMTEAGRAFNAATIDQYRDAGVRSFTWLAYTGACSLCQDQDGPHPITAPHPPAHPNCRCAMTGNVSSGLIGSTPAPAPSPITSVSTEAKQIPVKQTPVKPPKPAKVPKPTKLADEVNPAAPAPIEASPVIQEATITEAPVAKPINAVIDDDLDEAYMELAMEYLGPDAAEAEWEAVTAAIDNLIADGTITAQEVESYGLKLPAMEYKTNLTNVADAIGIKAEAKTTTELQTAINNYKPTKAKAPKTPKVEAKPASAPTVSPFGPTSQSNMQGWLRPITTRELSDAELEVLGDYQGEFYTNINGVLRGTIDKDAVNEFLEDFGMGTDIDAVIRNMDSAIRHAKPLPTNVVTYRGISYDTKEEFGRLMESLKPGMTYTDKAYSSTSLQQEVAEEFRENNAFGNGDGAIIKYELPRKTRAVAYPRYSTSAITADEREILLGRNVEYAVIDVKIEISARGKSYRIITLRPTV